MDFRRRHSRRRSVGGVLPGPEWTPERTRPEGGPRSSTKPYGYEMFGEVTGATHPSASPKRPARGQAEDHVENKHPRPRPTPRGRKQRRGGSPAPGGRPRLGGCVTGAPGRAAGFEFLLPPGGDKLGEHLWPTRDPRHRSPQGRTQVVCQAGTAATVSGCPRREVSPRGPTDRPLVGKGRPPRPADQGGMSLKS